ncbi:MAG TPA: serine/threonine-protein kinase [Kofleriaceae bacterium]|nr:serine/threonine-protein kinase [Kofleriaceae bacterium]
MSDSSPGERDTSGLSSCPTCKAVFRGGFQRCPNDGSRLTPGNEDPLVGSVLAERYYIESVIGDGGIGRVYRAQHTRMSRRFAIKVPFGELGYDRKQRARLSNEAEAASRLSHPNVIGIIDVGETADGLFYMAMDLAEGRHLGDIVTDGPIAPARALAILIQLAEGLAHAHERDLVHRDLKPENVTLTTGGPDGGEQVRIVDFGLAIVDSDEPRRNRLTTDGVVLGTPHYMAPEQATDEPLDFRTDLFALGLILFEMLAGIHPFDGAPMDVARQNLSRELPSIFDRSGVRVDPLLEALVTWLTQKVPADRPRETMQVARVARALLAGDERAAREMLPAALRPRGLEPALSAADAFVPLAPSVPVPAPGMVQPSAPHAQPFLLPQGDLLPYQTERNEGQESGSRRRFAIILAAIIVALAIVLGLALLGSDDDRARVAVVDDAAMPVLVMDAGVIDASDVDAVEMIVEPVDAAVRVRSVDAGRRPPPPPRVDAGVIVRPRIDAGVTAPPPSVDAGVPVQSPNATLRQLYERVGRQLDAAIAKHGRDKTDVFKRKFNDIPPYLEAARKDDLRKKAESQLRALEAELRALK